ncbi:phage holin family protein [Variovorax sp. OV700]|uniref:phage holin family protein n=1 Tax=Variovorax sp. OV700 TaxID=1882826 RepID=UPI00087EC4E4|nr:phage holin family protein [Variovorax sp. OV700]SDI08100.1 hypothetical protein SAMN05444748_103520 [Variovorax sp. OV700]
MNGVETRQAHVVKGFDPRYLFSKGFDLGCIDLIQGGSFQEAIGRTVVALLIGAIDKKTGKLPFSGVSVILSPATTTSLTPESVLQAIVSGTEALRGSVPDPEELEVLKRQLRVVSCPTLEVADLTAAVVHEGQKRLVAIAEASKYRDPTIIFPPVFGLSAVRTSEDLWASHVTSLCRQCVSAVKTTNGYAVVHVADIPAERPDNLEQLLSVDDCYVGSLQYEHDPEEEVNRRAQAWLSMALRGGITEAIKEIGELRLTEVARLHILAQLFHRAGRDDEALDVIGQMQSSLSSLTPSQLVQVSRIAHKAGDDSRARALLPNDADGIVEEIWLEEGLELATHLEDNVRIERFDARLTQIYPNSVRLRENRDRRLLLNCQQPKSDGGSVFTTAGFSEHHLALLRDVSVAEPNYDQAIEQARAWGTDWLELALICCAIHARSIGQSRDAANAASLITTSDLYGRQATQIVLSSVRAMMLKEEVGREERDYYRAPLLASIRFMAQHPEDRGIRSALSTLLSVESCGDLGIPIIALTMLDIAGEGVRLALPEKEAPEFGLNEAADNVEVDEDAIVQAIERGLTWLNVQGAAEFGVTVLPAELMGPYPDLVVQYISRIILRIGAQQGEDVDLVYMERMVLLACAMCPYATKERNEDLRVMRLLASHCAIAGQFQRARNLAEQVLLMGQGNGSRRRLAWLAFADVYHRCRNQVEALVGLACALATDAPVEKADLWQEVYAVIRILRDLGLHELARKFLPKLKELLSDLGFDPLTDLRIVSTELGLRLLVVKDTEPDEIATLVDELARGCELAANNRTELLPLAILLAQIVRKADVAGVPVDIQTRDLLRKTFGLVGEQASQMVETVSSVTPSALDVAAMFNMVQRALYAADAAGDYAVVGLAARRLLDGHAQQTPTDDDKALSVELLADHTVSVSGVPPDMVIDWPVRYAQSLNKEGLNVAFLGVDNAGICT